MKNSESNSLQLRQGCLLATGPRRRSNHWKKRSRSAKALSSSVRPMPVFRQVRNSAAELVHTEDSDVVGRSTKEEAEAEEEEEDDAGSVALGACRCTDLGLITRFMWQSDCSTVPAKAASAVTGTGGRLPASGAALPHSGVRRTGALGQNHREKARSAGLERRRAALEPWHG